MDTHFSAQSGRVKAWLTRRLRFLACVSGLFALFTSQVAAQTNPLVVSTVAGLANFGSADGIGSAAKFLLPAGVAVDGAGNVYVADAYNDTIRKVTSAGLVTTLAGTAQMYGYNDGTGSAARFTYPYGVAVDSAGNVYVADFYYATIRKITTNGAVTTIAGQAGVYGSTNGIGTNALFYDPRGIAVDGSGNIYVADTNMIRKMTNNGANWVVSTLAGSKTPGTNNGTGVNAQFDTPYGLATDSAGNVYVADTYNSLIRFITPAGVVTTIAANASPAFYNPTGIAVDSATNIYVADYDNQIIRKITPGGAVSTLAGGGFSGDESGDGDGIYPQATFNNPWGVAVDSAGNVYVGDSGNGNIRRITPLGTLSTLAGPDESYGVGGPVDSPAAVPRFHQPNGVAVDGATNLYVADTANNCIRLVTPAGTVTTLAGSINGDIGSANGTNTSAGFYYPSGLCLDAATNIYVADTYNSTVRKITPDATHSNWVTTTIAGLAGNTGTNNGAGTNARFWGPFAVAADSATNLYVTDEGNKLIRKLTRSGTNWAVTNYAAGPFLSPNGIAVDSSNNVYVADSGTNLIYMIATNGAVTTNGGALFNSPQGVAVDKGGNLYIASTGANTILGITSGGKSTNTIAGTAGFTGSADGLGSAAQFDTPIGLAVDASSNVYVADAFNNTIRKGTPDTAQTVVLTLTTSPDGLPLGVNGTNYAYTPQVFAFATNSTNTVTATTTNTVTATTTNGYVFTNWTQGGTVESTSSNYTFTPGSNETLVANFLSGYILTVSASPTNGGTVSPGGTFLTGSTNTVEATNNSGYAFTGWTSNGIPAVSTTNYTFTLSTNVTLVANFLPLYMVTVSASPTNGGTVSPGGTNESGSSITVYATNNSGYGFAGWTSNGIPAVSTTNYTFTLSTNVTLVANFLPLYTVTVSASPTNGGTVSPGGTFLTGSTNTVEATNNSGYAFTGWTSNGIPAVSTTNYTFTLSTNVTLVANFLPLYTVTVSASPTNGGTVSPGGTNVSGSTNTVTATNNSGYVFAGWTSNGIAAVSTTNCTFTLSTNVTLVANFLPLYTVTVSASPTNGGTVSGGGTNVSGSTNTVTATANSGYLFTNWTTNGIVASTSNNYTFTLNGNETLVANFVTTPPPTLFITRSNGVMFLFWTNSATGFALESTTNLKPAVWAVVTNPPALSGGFFIVSNVWPDSMRLFQLVSPIYTLTVSASPTNGGTVSGGGMFAAGNTNTVTATANGGYVFTNWTLGATVVSTSSTYTFPGSNETLVANFVTTALPLLSITQSNGFTFLFWTNSASQFTLESTTNLNPANWAAVTNDRVQSGGYFIVSNAWPDQTRFFQLISQ